VRSRVIALVILYIDMSTLESTTKTICNVIYFRLQLRRSASADLNMTSFLESLKPIEDDMHGLGDLQELEGALKGLIMLKETYNINLIDMAQSSGNTFSMSDMYMFAVQSFNMKWYDSTISFLRDSSNTSLTDGGSSLIKSELKRLQRVVIELNNKNLMKKRKTIGEDFKVLPYIVDEDLGRKKSQPKFVKTLSVPPGRDPYDENQFRQGEVLEDVDRMICRGDLVGEFVKPEKCHFLHQDDPYLRLAPHKMEILLRDPFRMIFHDFLSEEEINFLIEHSTPRLSRARVKHDTNRYIKKNEIGSKKVRIVAKTVQCWIEDIKHNGTVKILDDDTFVSPEDPYSFYIVHPIMHRLSKKIEMATKLRLQSQLASSLYQTTNYGLGGLCESHIDPHGYIEGMELTSSRRELIYSGDMIATFMAWLNDVKSGGNTACDWIGYEQTMTPTRGSAAFWMNLDKKGFRERRSQHTGCPVLGGSKWILNKWVYYFDQFKSYPCGLDYHEAFGPFTGYYK
jgi:hypothetical protein